MTGNPPSIEILTAQLWQLTTLVANLATPFNNLDAAGAANPAPVVAAFTLTPGLTAGNNLINFNMTNGPALYKAGIEPLPTPFHLKAEQVIVFEKALANKVSSMGWNKGAKKITTYLNQDDLTIDLISEYGQIDHQTLKTTCKEFVKETGARGQQSAA